MTQLSSKFPLIENREMPRKQVEDMGTSNTGVVRVYCCCDVKRRFFQSVNFLNEVFIAEVFAHCRTPN